MKGQASALLKLAAEDGQRVDVFVPPAADAAPEYMGRFFINAGYPMRGSQADAQGRMWYLLQCFEIPQEATHMNGVTFSETRDAKYIPYFGLVSTKGHHEKGLVIGYIEDCYGSPTLVDSERGEPDMTITSTRSMMMSRPRMAYEGQYPRFGAHAPRVAPIDEQIAIEARAQLVRNPPRPTRIRSSIA